MLKYALMAVAAATVVAVVFIMLPTGSGPRPEPRLLASGDPQTSTSFTIHDASPPTPVTLNPPTPPTTAPANLGALTTPPSPGDLDAVMQRLRATAGNPSPPDATVSATTTAPPPAAPTPAPADAAAVPPPNPPAPRWASVTAQGTRWRLARSNSGYVVSIDLGGGQVADVHVLPAFANLDPAAVNVRVDYLHETILQNFSNQSGSYSFARDGSVSLDR